MVKISNDFNISLDNLLKEDKHMIEDISRKQKKYDFIKIFIIILNILSIIYLLYFSIRFITNPLLIETIEKNNNSNLETSSFFLFIGLLPTIIINYKTYIYYDYKKNILSFLPSLLFIIIILLIIFIHSRVVWINQY